MFKPIIGKNYWFAISMYIHTAYLSFSNMDNRWPWPTISVHSSSSRPTEVNSRLIAVVLLLAEAILVVSVVHCSTAMLALLLVVLSTYSHV